MVEQIILASPRGFCAGVDRAIKVVELALKGYGKPIYVRHEIVHNKHVVEDLKQKGAIFVENLSKIPEGSNVIFSAHGVPPTIVQEAKDRNLRPIDTTCPLVTKVHVEARRYHNQGYSILLIGHKGHQEVIGTMGEAPMILVENVEQAKIVEVPNPNKVAYITQTTLSLDETKEIIAALKERFPNLHAPAKEDICYATTNRQNAVRELSKQCDLILVVGSKNSSNSNRLRDGAIIFGTTAYLIDDYSMIDESWLEGVSKLGITSGASVPEKLVQELVNHIKESNPSVKIENCEAIKENMGFLLPKELR